MAAQAKWIGINSKGEKIHIADVSVTNTYSINLSTNNYLLVEFYKRIIPMVLLKGKDDWEIVKLDKGSAEYKDPFEKTNPIGFIVNVYNYDMLKKML